VRDRVISQTIQKSHRKDFVSFFIVIENDKSFLGERNIFSFIDENQIVANNIDLVFSLRKDKVGGTRLDQILPFEFNLVLTQNDKGIRTVIKVKYVFIFYSFVDGRFETMIKFSGKNFQNYSFLIYHDKNSNFLYKN